MYMVACIAIEYVMIQSAHLNILFKCMYLSSNLIATEAFNEESVASIMMKTLGFC